MVGASHDDSYIFDLLSCCTTENLWHSKKRFSGFAGVVDSGMHTTSAFVTYNNCSLMKGDRLLS